MQTELLLSMITATLQSLQDKKNLIIQIITS